MANIPNRVTAKNLKPIGKPIFVNTPDVNPATAILGAEKIGIIKPITPKITAVIVTLTNSLDAMVCNFSPNNMNAIPLEFGSGGDADESDIVIFQ